MKNSLLKNIQKIRDQIGAEYGYDLKRLGALIYEEEIKVGKRLIHQFKFVTRSTYPK